MNPDPSLPCPHVPPQRDLRSLLAGRLRETAVFPVLTADHTDFQLRAVSPALDEHVELVCRRKGLGKDDRVQVMNASLDRAREILADPILQLAWVMDNIVNAQAQCRLRDRKRTTLSTEVGVSHRSGGDVGLDHVARVSDVSAGPDEVLANRDLCRVLLQLTGEAIFRMKEAESPYAADCDAWIRTGQHPQSWRATQAFRIALTDVCELRATRFPAGHPDHDLYIVLGKVFAVRRKGDQRFARIVEAVVEYLTSSEHVPLDQP